MAEDPKFKVHLLQEAPSTTEYFQYGHHTSYYDGKQSRHGRRAPRLGERIPWTGFTAIIGVVIGIAAMGITLGTSDAKPRELWPSMPNLLMTGNLLSTDRLQQRGFQSKLMVNGKPDPRFRPMYS